MIDEIAPSHDFPRSVTTDLLFEMHFLQSAQLSPDDRHVCAVVSTYDSAQDADIHHLWLYSLTGASPRQLTQHNCVNTNPVWSPDGMQIAFTSDRGPEGKPQIYILSLAGGEPRQVTSLPQGVTGSLAWSPDGKSIAFSTVKEQSSTFDPGDPYRVTRHVYRFDAIGYLDQGFHQLFVVSIPSGAIQQLTHDERHNINPQWAPDGQKLLYGSMLAPDVHAGISLQLHMVELGGKITELVGAEWGETMGSAVWLANSQSIAFVGNRADLPIGSKNDLFTMDIDGGYPVNQSAGSLTGVGGGLQADMPTTLLRQPARLLASADGGSVYGRVQMGGALHLYKMALDGSETRSCLLSGERCVVALGLTSDENQILFAASDINSPWELFVLDLADSTETQLTNLNGEMLQSLHRTEAKHLLYPSKDGAEVEGWLFQPANTEGPLPTVLYIHGGPHSAFGHIYHCDTQLLMGLGYAVLMINHRASMGYGDAFSTAIKGDWGNLDYADLMAGVDAAIDSGWVDGERLGVCGLSGGGNLSCWIVGQTDRFKAAVPENPLTNWSSFYGVSDIGVWFGVEQLGGHLHEIPETYIRCSPITYAHRCTTPTLLVQCESDWRCPAEQSEQFYNVLKANGCTVEMLRLPGGSHGGCVTGLPKLRRAQNEALLDWMRRYV